MEKRYLAMWMWLCEGKLKVKTAHFRLPSAFKKRACLFEGHAPHARQFSLQIKVSHGNYQVVMAVMVGKFN